MRALPFRAARGTPPHALISPLLLLACSAPPRGGVAPVRMRSIFDETRITPIFFELSVELGEGNGAVYIELPALFTDSVLLTVRYALPFALEAEGIDRLRVVKPGNGLQVGDVLRACSTPEMRYSSSQGSMGYGEGLRGQPPSSAADDDSGGFPQLEEAAEAAAGGEPAGLFGSLFKPLLGSAVVKRARSELGGFKEQRPRKVLFLTDGRTPAEVRDALTANTLDRGVESIVMLFERPLMAALVGDADQNAMM